MMTHDQAIDALCGCAATVTVLSYQEAIEAYFDLRGMDIPATRTSPGESGEDALVHLLRSEVFAVLRRHDVSEQCFGEVAMVTFSALASPADRIET